VEWSCDQRRRFAVAAAPANKCINARMTEGLGQASRRAGESVFALD
jgi:hypothetical protein